MIEQAAGCCISTSTPRISLVSDCRTTRRRSEAHIELVIDPVFDEALLDLGGELAGRLDNQCASDAARARPFSSIVSIGSVKAAVLPVPVWAIRARRAAPAREESLVLEWGGVV